MLALRGARSALFTLALAASLACAADGTQRSTGVYVDDKVVSAKVKAALIDDPTTKAYQIDVSTYEGVVQLSGFVDDSKSISTAEQVAESVEGVKEVRNDLRLKAR